MTERKSLQAAPAQALRRAASMVALSLLGSACSLVPKAPAEQVSLHVLDVRPVVTRTARREHVLAVGPLRAAPGADSASIAYLQAAHGLDHYATHRWADTPARMLDPVLMRTLEDAGDFRAVVPAGSSVQADLRLDTEIVQLRQSFLTRPSRVELTLRTQLVDVLGRRVLATRYFEVVEDAPSDDALGGVLAANAAVGRVLAQVAAFCVEASGELTPRATSAPAAGGSAGRP